MTVFYANMRHKKRHLIHKDFALDSARSVTNVNTTCQIQAAFLEGREALGGGGLPLTPETCTYSIASAWKLLQMALRC